MDRAEVLEIIREFVNAGGHESLLSDALDEAEGKMPALLIIDPAAGVTNFEYVLTDEDFNLLSSGYLEKSFIASFSESLDIKSKNVFIDMGVKAVMVLALCERKGYTPIKGSGTGSANITHTDKGVAVQYVNFERLPFSLIRE